MSLESSSGRRETVTAFFDHRAEAQAALDDLRDEGLSDASMRLIEGSENRANDTSHEHKGFWRSLGDLFMPEEDRGTYAEGLSRGGYVVSVQTTADNRDTVLAILDKEGTVDLDEREASWRAEGWSGYRGSDLGDRAATDDLTARTETMGLRSGIAGVGAAAPRSWERADASLDTSGASAGAGDRLARRETVEGRSRVRSYVWDEPNDPEFLHRRSEVEIDDERAEAERRATGTSGRIVREN